MRAISAPPSRPETWTFTPFAPEGEPRLEPRTAARRLIGIILAALPLGLGFLAVLVSDRRRGLHDRIANTEVILVDRHGRPEAPDHRATLEPAR